MDGHLLNRDIDWLIAKRLLRDGRPNAARPLNQLLIAFAPLTKFTKILMTRYQQLVCRYRQINSIEDLIPSLIHNNSFWYNAIKDFSQGKPGDIVVFDGGQKGLTRKRLYTLGMVFGYRYTVTNRQPYETHGKGGRIPYHEDKVDRSKLYTMGQLRRLKVNFPGLWLDSGQVNERGKVLYMSAGPDAQDEDGRSWYKRGVMSNGTGIITFTRL
jgi:signal peptidase I